MGRTCKAVGLLLDIRESQLATAGLQWGSDRRPVQAEAVRPGIAELSLTLKLPDGKPIERAPQRIFPATATAVRSKQNQLGGI